MEPTSFLLGVLAAVQQASDAVASLRARRAAFRSNPTSVRRLQSACAHLKHDLEALNTQLTSPTPDATVMDIPPANYAAFNRLLTAISDTLNQTRATLAAVDARLTRGPLARFAFAKSIAATCDGLARDVTDARPLVVQLHACLAAVSVAHAVADAQTHTLSHAASSHERATRAHFDDAFAELRHALPAAAPPPPAPPPDVFRPTVAVLRNTPEVLLDFSSAAQDGTPLTNEGRLKATLVDRLAASATVVAAVGMSGVGKTCALRGLVDDSGVLELFPDGVYEMTLGMDASIRTAVGALCSIVALSGGETLAQSLEAATSLNNVIQRTAVWFHGKKVLLLVDDIWNRNKLGATFIRRLVSLVSGPHGAALVFTTRAHDVAIEGSVVRFEPRDPRGSQSRMILLQCANSTAQDVRGPEAQQAFEQLLDVCAGLPVAHAVVGKAVALLAVNFTERRERAWSWFLSRERGRLRPQREDVGDYRNLASSFSATLQILDDTNFGSLSVSPTFSFAEMHRALCVLHKQGWAPLNMLRALWQCEDEQSAGEILHQFAQVSLVTIVWRKVGSRDVEGLMMHDLLHDFAREQADQAGPILKVHRLLLEGYACRESKAAKHGIRCEWWEIENDGYIFENLCRHLAMGKCNDELQRLLLSPEWTVRQFLLRGLLQLEQDFATGEKSLESESCARGSDAHEGLRLILGAVRLGAEFIDSHPEQVWFQLYGRLVGEPEKCKAVQTYMHRIELTAPRPWLKCRRSLLTTSGGAMTTLLSLGKGLRHIVGLGDSGNVACATQDEVRVVDMRKRKCQRRWNVPNVCFLDATGDGKIIVTLASSSWGPNTAACKGWEAWSGKFLFQFDCVRGFKDVPVHADLFEPSPAHDVCTLKISSDGCRIAFVLSDGTASVWDIETRKQTCAPFEENGYEMSCIALSADGTTAVSGGKDGAVWMWSTETGMRTGEALKGHTGTVLRLTMTLDGQRVVSTAKDLVVNVWDCSDLSLMASYCGHSCMVLSLATSPDGRHVFSSDINGETHVWLAADGTATSESLRGGAGMSCGVVTCRDKGVNAVITANADGFLRVWHWDRQTLEIAEAGHMALGWGRQKLALALDGTRAVSVGPKGTMRGWDTWNGALLWAQDRERIEEIAVSSDARLVFTTGVELEAGAWDLATGARVGRLSRSCGIPDRAVHYATTRAGESAVAFFRVQGRDGSGARIANMEVCVRDVITGAEKTATLRGVQDSIIRLAFSTDWEQAVTATATTATLWDTRTGAAVRQTDVRGDELPRCPQALAATVGEDVERYNRCQVVERDGACVRLHNGLGTGATLATFEVGVADVAAAADGTVFVALDDGRVGFAELVR